MKVIKDVLAKRTTYDQVLQLLQSQLPTGGVITTLSMKENTVTLTVVSKSLEIIQTFIANITQGVENKMFSQAIMSNLLVDSEKAEFQVTVEVILL